MEQKINSFICRLCGGHLKIIQDCKSFIYFECDNKGCGNFFNIQVKNDAVKRVHENVCYEFKNIEIKEQEND